MDSEEVKLALNKNFAKNILKQVDDHNRVKSDIESRSHRKFENNLRKKHTLRNLERFSSSSQKTMYSDYYDVSNKPQSSSKKPKKSFITPLEQVQKLVIDAAAFDKSMAERDNDQIFNNKRRTAAVVKSNRISLDKTLLHNHLKHTSVHNRLKEEDEMWGQHVLQKKRKITSLQSKSAREQTKKGGSMYSDREAKNVKPVRVKSAHVHSGGSFGEWTKQLLVEKDKDPNKWSHSGFQAMYHDELVTSDDFDQRIISVSDDSDKEVSSRKPVNGRRRIVKIGANSVGNGRSPKKSKNIRSAKSIIKETLQNGNTNGKAPKRKFLYSLHADDEEGEQEEEEERDRRKTKRLGEVKRSTSKWSHDRFQEGDSTVSHGDAKSKSLLLNVDSDDEWTEKKNGTEGGRKGNLKSRTVVGKKSDVKVMRSDPHDDSVNRVTLRNSIHEEISEKPRKRLVLSKQKATTRKRGDASDSYTSTETSAKEVEKKSTKRKNVNRKRIVKRKRNHSSTDDSSSSSSSLSGSSDSDSSLTESSTDEKRKNTKKKKTRSKGKSRGRKDNRHRATFSDYDSDFQPRRE